MPGTVQAFGLRLRLGFELHGAVGDDASARLRPARLDLDDRVDHRSAGDAPPGGSCLASAPLTDELVAHSMHEHQDGYRLFARYHGTFHVSRDGTHVRCS